MKLVIWLPLVSILLILTVIALAAISNDANLSPEEQQRVAKSEAFSRGEWVEEEPLPDGRRCWQKATQWNRLGSPTNKVVKCEGD